MDHGALAAFSAVWAESRRVQALQRRVAELQATVLHLEGRAAVCRCLIANCPECGRALLIMVGERYEGSRETQQCECCDDYYCRAHFPEDDYSGCCPRCRSSDASDASDAN